MTFEQWLRSVMERRKLRAGQVAQKTGFSAQTISSWLKGAQPRAENLGQVAKGLKEGESLAIALGIIDAPYVDVLALPMQLDDEALVLIGQVNELLSGIRLLNDPQFAEIAQTYLAAEAPGRELLYGVARQIRESPPPSGAADPAQAPAEKPASRRRVAG